MTCFVLPQIPNPGIASLCKEFIVDDFNNPETVSSYATKNNISMAVISQKILFKMES